MLRDRFITAGVLVAIIVPLIVFAGAEGIALLVAVFGGVGLWELAGRLSALKSAPGKQLTLVLGLGIVAAVYAVPWNFTAAVFCWFPLLVLLVHLLLYHRISNTVDSASQMVFALAYVVVPLSHAILLRRIDPGIAWIYVVLVVVCLGDTGAYFAGRYFGKHRLSPNISPGKTFEGLGGCLLGGLIGMLIVKIVFSGLPPLKTMLVLTLVLTVCGPIGDLFASMLKRRLEIKDFGAIMPGHGGVLDRADSLILSFPAAYYFLLLMGETPLK